MFEERPYLLFLRRPLLVNARRAAESGYVNARGKHIPVNVGDWLVTEDGQKTHVMSDQEFQEGYEPFDDKFRKRPLIVRAMQAGQSTHIRERGVLIPVQPTDWFVRNKFTIFVLSNEDFSRVYEPLE